MTHVVEPWRVLAGRGRMSEAAELLRPRLSGAVRMGYYAAEGYRFEKLGDEAQGEDAKRRHWEAALEHYLLYSLAPARGDTSDYGWGLAGDVLAKLATL
jgi:hypothetical protein